tara:strand:+ start:449 stop:940 length:492 start_codon:yes stop_codon:yes gene_type:complete
MPDYKNAKIYKLWSPEGDDIYIGSTTKYLSTRKAQHKYKYDKNTITCKSSILYEKYNDVRIELLECFPCENKDELNKKENEYIRNNNCVNKRIEGRTTKEWYEDNKESHKLWKKNYYEENKQKQLTKVSVLYVCECGKELTIGKKARHEKTKFHLNYLTHQVS